MSGNCTRATSLKAAMHVPTGRRVVAVGVHGILAVVTYRRMHAHARTHPPHQAEGREPTQPEPARTPPAGSQVGSGRVALGVVAVCEIVVGRVLRVVAMVGVVQEAGHSDAQLRDAPVQHLPSPEAEEPRA